MNMVTAELLRGVGEECEVLLKDSEDALLLLESDPTNTEAIGSLFRAFHTIKGSAGLFGLDMLVAFTHLVESVLGKVREGELTTDEDLVSLFLDSRDHLEGLTAFVLAGNDALDDTLQATEDALRARLSSYLDDAPAPQAATPAASPSSPAAETTAREVPAGGVQNSDWHISLRFGADALRNGMDPMHFIAYLEKLGELSTVLLLCEELPEWQGFDPESCYLGFEIKLHADTDKQAIEEVFEFVQDDCELHIQPPHGLLDDYIALIDALPEEPMKIGRMLVAVGALTEREVEQALATQQRLADDLTGDGHSEGAPVFGEVAVQQHMVAQPVIDAAVRKQVSVAKGDNPAQQTVRVNAAKLESLINLVGELVIGGANADLMARQTANGDLIEAMESMSRLVEEIRDTTLGLRMVQIGETFNRFRRVVREVSKDLDKPIELVINGADTELDKTVVEKIGDPLMHLVRNAMDHGIERSEVRVASGKPETGTVTLDAYHDSGSIVIRIADDGGGLDAARIRAKAIEKGLINESDNLTENEIYRLIFEAGFSTAEQVTDLSGRGVGMDVVRRNIESLRGQIEVDSNAGKGSTFTIRLPLTLAIIDGFEVRVGKAHYIVPLDMVDECIELTQSVAETSQGGDYINLRGEVLPFVRLESLFGNASGERDKGDRDNIVIAQFAGQKTGLVVDELLGEHQTVIKPLGKVFQHLESISGATILGNGEVALIVDVPSLVHRVITNSRRLAGLRKSPTNARPVH